MARDEPEPSAGRRFEFLDRPLAEATGIAAFLTDGFPNEDEGLRFYLDVLGLEHLHYGLWAPNDPLTLDGLRTAQTRYRDHLIDLIPEGVERVLDVGCGAGGNAAELLSRGYRVEGLSPDAGHGRRFVERTGCPFHHSRFEDFRTTERFDLVFLSESCQYVRLAELFPALERAVVSGGHALLSDYFVLEKDGSYLARSGHLLADFEAEVASSGFQIEHEEDITRETAPTLDSACALVDRYLIPTLRLALVRGGRKKPRLTRFVLRYLAKRLRTVDERKQNVDSRLFVEKKRYRVYRLRAPASLPSR